MHIGVLIPVGPGHEKLAIDARKSVLDADWPDGWKIDTYVLEDHKGEVGRGRARNVLTYTAQQEGCDWVFYLDADDLVFPGAFRGFEVAVHVNPDLEAVWGEIWSERAWSAHGEIQMLDVRRYRSCRSPLSTFEELLAGGPHGNLCMGCFIRPSLWEKVGGFYEDWDVGEDHEFCYACCVHAASWAKLQRRFIKIRNWLPSAHGPRGYDMGIPIFLRQAHDRAVMVSEYWKERGAEPWNEYEKTLREEGRLYSD